MKKTYTVTPALCVGCKTCEMSCAFAHPVKGQPGVSRIRIDADLQGRPGLSKVVVCLQCEEAACVAACPANALWKDAELGVIKHLEERCIHCASCVAACPFGNMHWEAKVQFPRKCDLCLGDPKCARFCPTGALRYE
jgi:carbon-monoxide dehydrogenase iron sulfur subunit